MAAGCDVRARTSREGVLPIELAIFCGRPTEAIRLIASFLPEEHFAGDLNLARTRAFAAGRGDIFKVCEMLLAAGPIDLYPRRELVNYHLAGRRRLLNIQQTLRYVESQKKELEHKVARLSIAASSGPSSSSGGSSSRAFQETGITIDERWCYPLEEIGNMEVIASGAVGSVYKALWKAGTVVALKEFHLMNPEIRARIGNDLSASQTPILQFFKECQVNAQVRHPNLVSFYGIIRDRAGKPRYLMFEFLAGGTLHSWLYHRGVNQCPESAKGCSASVKPLAEVMPILCGICNALVYLHSQVPKIFHWDLKPKNIMLDSSGAVKVCDLGEGHILKNPEAGATMSGHGVGTPLYMAPEMRFEGEARDERTDMFMFGVIMLEIASGREPNPAEPFVDRVAVPESIRRKQDLEAVRLPQLLPLIQKLISDRPVDRLSAVHTLNDLQTCWRKLYT